MRLASPSLSPMMGPDSESSSAPKLDKETSFFTPDLRIASAETLRRERHVRGSVSPVAPVTAVMRSLHGGNCPGRVSALAAKPARENRKRNIDPPRFLPSRLYLGVTIYNRNAREAHRHLPRSAQKLLRKLIQLCCRRTIYFFTHSSRQQQAVWSHLLFVLKHGSKPSAR